MNNSTKRDMEEIQASGLFEAKWYLETYPDVKALGMEPIEHYLWLGARLRRDPSLHFDAAAYLAQNADVADADVNPLLHYVRWGKREGRSLTRAFDPMRKPTANSPQLQIFDGYRQRVQNGHTVLAVAHIVSKKLFGSERSFLDILDGFAAIDVNVVAVLPKHLPFYTKEVRTRSCETVIFDYPWWRCNDVSTKMVKTFENIISEKSIDVVHVNTIMLREPLIAAVNCGVQSVVHARELIHQDKWLAQVIGESPDDIVEQTLGRADWIMANSQATANTFFKQDKTFVVPNTIDTQELLMSNVVDYKKVRFGIISSNIPKKGIHDIVALARACKKTVPNANFLIIGPETDLIRELRISQAEGRIPITIEFSGYANSPRDAIQKANVVLSLSHFAESFGRTVLEAMAARRPVIAYRWGAIPELVVDNVTGYLIPYRQPELAEHAVKMLCLNRKQIYKMGIAAQRVAQDRYSKDQYAKYLRNAYEKIFSNKKKLQSSANLNGNKNFYSEKKIDSKTLSSSRRVVKAARNLPKSRTLSSEHTRLRIAYFCWHFPVPSETFVLNELRYLVKRGNDVVVFCRQSPHKNFVPDFPIKCKQVSTPDKLAQQLIETGRNVVHGHFVYPTVTEFLWPACEKAKIPFTFIAHAQDIFRYVNDKKNRIADIVRSPLCLRLFVLSKFHRKYLIERGVPREKIVINPNAIDASMFKYGAIPDRSMRKFKAICAVHRFCEKKGLENLIRAGKELSRDGIRIDLYGYGPLEEKYRTIIAELGLENVRICGPVQNREQLIEVFRQYDLFACPSVRAEDGDMDGIPTSIAEAMAAGLPVMATAVSGIPDLVSDGITGIVCEPNAASIAKAVKRYYAMFPAQVEAIINFAKNKVVEKHDIRRLARVLLRVWEQKTIDIVIVSWTHVDEHREVLRRLYEYTSLPFNIIVSINSNNDDVVNLLEEYYKQKDNITLVYNGYNAMVGPGTNQAIDAGKSDIAIYICGREGFALRSGWEIEFVHHFEENPEVGQAGTLCHSPNYLTGAQYASNIALFPKFRNKSYANESPDRIFQHVQGGLFAIRRTMYDTIGGFSDEVPHDYTDIEYSFYAESRGWKLGEVETSVSVYNKTRPPLFARIDEGISAVHPLRLYELDSLDRIARGKVLLQSMWMGQESYLMENRKKV